jgi:HAD superfamily hydrolase (TIGR01549 family)
MNKKHVIVFDFDGTISDSVVIMFQILNKMSKSYGFRRILKSELSEYRKMGTEELIKELKISKEHLPAVIDEIHKGLAKNANNIKPVEGMIEVIKSLTLAGYKMGILTTNTRKNVVDFLKKYKIECFQYIYPMAGLYGKAELLKNLIDEHRITAEKVVYIGDETRDIEAGRSCQVKTVAVTWGLNGREALSLKNPDWLIDNPKQLREIFK